jgi:hypothetical protein
MAVQTRNNRNADSHIESNGARIFSLLLDRHGLCRDTFHELPPEQKLAIAQTLREAFAPMRDGSLSWEQFRDVGES